MNREIKFKMKRAMYMKKNILLTFVLFIMLLSTGCTYGTHFTIGSVENNTMNSMSMKYAKFSGNKNKEFTVKEGETIKVEVDITTESGKIDLYIESDKGETIYEGHSLETQNFTVNISDSGKYKVRLEAKNHKGSYTIKWK